MLVASADAAVTTARPATETEAAAHARDTSPADRPFIPAESDSGAFLITFPAPDLADGAIAGGWKIGFVQIAALGLALLSLVVFIRRRQRRRIGWGVLPERSHPTRPVNLMPGSEDSAF
ncbi:hypothetical protein GCM10011529_27520 [Polymorphobacter glacialis]|uniref:Uncharacterized protein n=1 Tax=Sandarakinorhabdus glacialis TaxID=1614636 RepID=A0A916ZZC6_9SPHN|nr:hypothetical protein [Polymorphobacter glacialis]GGE19467.1 hypothetical protein GCM10011529_27520 [Polymorphobacter glacialis]